MYKVREMQKCKKGFYIYGLNSTTSKGFTLPQPFTAR